MTTLVRLVPIALSDEAEFLAAVAHSRKLHRPWVSPPTAPAEFRTLVEPAQGPANSTFVVRHESTHALVGFINISNIIRGSFHSAFLGYYAFAGHERQGLMRAGLALAIRTAFAELKLHRLEANIQPENLASIALVRSCGFALEGYSPRYLKIRGRWRDHERWAILAR
ncbi:MAG: family N-acetyltransferase [Ramlibacter sp.]|nr:family N-acetyltransferase [Ramlibacter sp.]